ncbi:MAG TPA: C-GCAxxG-C-C family protein [Candidatus Lokiarchaeia archaeon]|nr:C-GCAxxG-C-C family protein [Candidatus Lokiarchaeia archaeon]
MSPSDLNHPGSIDQGERITSKDKAIEIYKQGFNCAQSVFTAYRQDEELSEEASLRLATMFGAGVACTGTGLCGAVTGALMAISMKHGRGTVDDLEAKPRTYELGKQFMTKFKEKVGSCICEEIIGVNIGTPEQLQEARDLKLFETTCLDAVKTAADILDQIL